MSALRLSVLTDETTSPERQREANRAAAAALGIDLGDREAVDLGVSASKTTPFERPELKEWLRRPEDFDALLFWRFDRAVRSMDDMHALSTWARDHRKMIVFAEGPGGRLVLDFRNPLDPMAQLMVTLFAFAAQMEAQAIRERVTSTQAAMRVMQLRWRGSRPPYGYKPAPLEGGGWTLVQDPEAVPVIERMIRELMDGSSAAAIAAGLNRDSVPSPRDHWSLRQGRETGGKTGGRAGETVTRGRFAWRHGTVKGVLTSERVLGWKLAGEKPVRDSEGAPVMATPEPILTREEFDAIGARFAELAMEDSAGAADRVDTVALLLRVIICDGCGGRLYLQRAGRTEIYRCGSITRGHACAARATIKRTWAEDFVEREFLRAVGGLRLTQTRTVPGYDPQPEIDATAAEYEAHMESEGTQTNPVTRGIWEKRRDALDKRVTELMARDRVEPRTEVTHTGRTFVEEWEAADTGERRAMLVEAGAQLRVRRAKRGKHEQLDEGRVSFELKEPFFADAAMELGAVL
ncbi:recombinase family protein [Actinacidiphila glaucinigra]|uniref:recombinase family protein n=1 Tax=Actinacidiphila glaucinigra TaxID=235986 RepID=UPI000B77BEC8|nr:recombinase family protein [Actinacidiphila glaucinigra]